MFTSSVPGLRLEVPSFPPLFFCYGLYHTGPACTIGPFFPRPVLTIPLGAAVSGGPESPPLDCCCSAFSREVLIFPAYPYFSFQAFRPFLSTLPTLCFFRRSAFTPLRLYLIVHEQLWTPSFRPFDPLIRDRLPTEDLHPSQYLQGPFCFFFPTFASRLAMLPLNHPCSFPLFCDRSLSFDHIFKSVVTGLWSCLGHSLC